MDMDLLNFFVNGYGWIWILQKSHPCQSLLQEATVSAGTTVGSGAIDSDDSDSE